VVEVAKEYSVIYACEKIGSALKSKLYVYFNSRIPGGCRTNSNLTCVILM